MSVIAIDVAKTDCPKCKAKACGHLCWCGTTGTKAKVRQPHNGQHRYCCTCRTCYVPATKEAQL